MARNIRLTQCVQTATESVRSKIWTGIGYSAVKPMGYKGNGWESERVPSNQAKGTDTQTVLSWPFLTGDLLISPSYENGNGNENGNGYLVTDLSPPGNGILCSHLPSMFYLYSNYKSIR